MKIPLKNKGKMMKKNLKQAFTVAEVLITIALISILVALAMPTIIKSQESPSEAPWKFVTMGDLSQNSAVYTVLGGSAVSVIGDKRVPVDTNITDNQSRVFASKINPKISVVARNKSSNPLISRHLIDFYEKDLVLPDKFYNIGKISFDSYYNVAVGKNVLDNIKTPQTANFGNFSDDTLWTDLTDETDTNLKGALNTAIGQYAMGGDRKYLSNSPEYPTRNMEGGANTAIGAFALRKNTTGDFNTAIGAYSLESATDTDAGMGSKNIAIGCKSLRNSKSDNNTAVGYETLYSNTTRSSDTAIGYQSLYSSNAGHPRTAIGYQSLYFSNNGSGHPYSNTAIGYQSLYSNKLGFANMAIGNKALYSNTSAENTAIGNNVLALTTTAGENTVIGYEAMSRVVTGGDNTVMGRYALHYASGKRNVAVGLQSMDSSDANDCDYNVSAGNHSLLKINSSDYNIALGVGALAALNTAGSDHNIAIGKRALFRMTSGSYNIAVGQVANTLTSSNNKIYISANSNYNSDNSLIYGDDSARKLYFNVTNNQAYIGDMNSDNQILTKEQITTYLAGANDFDILNSKIAYSDSRLKDITGDNTSGLKEILKIKVKNFTMKNDKNKEVMTGVIAQELKKVFPNSVFKGSDGYLKIKRDEIFYACVNAIKELYSMLQDAAAKISGLDKKITVLEEQNRVNEEMLSLLEKQNAMFEERLSALKNGKIKTEK